MGWLQRLFGQDKSEAAQGATSSADQEVPPERVGLNGQYDQSGLAKRVAAAFDEDQQLDDVDTVYIAQTSSTVVLKGKVPNQDFLNKMVDVAKRVDGATEVNAEQVNVG